MEDHHEQIKKRIVGVVAAYYANTFCVRSPCRTSRLSGASWIAELIHGNPTRIYKNLRMNTSLFVKLVNILTDSGTLRATRHMEVSEQVAIFLFTVSQSAKNRDAQERFQRSGETISRVLRNVTVAICRMACDYIRLPANDTPLQIRQNPKMYPFFQNCRMAFDGTHIAAFVSAKEAQPYRNRKGFLSQNIFAACSFDLCFTYILAGWEGSAADSTVLSDARLKGFTTPKGKFDLGDAGYALTTEVMTPYRGVRYHLREWKQGNMKPQTAKELYNLRHSQMRNAIERIFGILKRRFPIIVHAPEFSLEMQAHLFIACCVLHNFIRMSGGAGDLIEQQADLEMEKSATVADITSDTVCEITEASTEAKLMRDGIAAAMWCQYQTILDNRQ